MFKKVTDLKGNATYLPTETANAMAANKGEMERMGFSSISEEEYEEKPVKKGTAIVNQFVKVGSKTQSLGHALEESGKKILESINQISEATGIPGQTVLDAALGQPIQPVPANAIGNGLGQVPQNVADVINSMAPNGNVITATLNADGTATANTGSIAPANPGTPPLVVNVVTNAPTAEQVANSKPKGGRPSKAEMEAKRKANVEKQNEAAANATKTEEVK